MYAPLRAHLAVMCAVQVDLGETFGVGPGGLHRSDFEKMILTTPRGSVAVRAHAVCERVCYYLCVWGEKCL